MPPHSERYQTRPAIVADLRRESVQPNRVHGFGLEVPKSKGGF